MSNSLLDNYQKTVFAFVVVAVVVVAVVVEETRGLYIPLISQVEVRMERFGPNFFLPFMPQARRSRAMKTRKEEKNEDPYLAVRI